MKGKEKKREGSLDIKKERKGKEGKKRKES